MSFTGRLDSFLSSLKMRTKEGVERFLFLLGFFIISVSLSMFLDGCYRSFKRIDLELKTYAVAVDNIAFCSEQNAKESEMLSGDCSFITDKKIFKKSIFSIFFDFPASEIEIPIREDFRYKFHTLLQRNSITFIALRDSFKFIKFSLLFFSTVSVLYLLLFLFKTPIQLIDMELYDSYKNSLLSLPKEGAAKSVTGGTILLALLSSTAYYSNAKINEVKTQSVFVEAQEKSKKIHNLLNYKIWQVVDVKKEDNGPKGATCRKEYADMDLQCGKLWLIRKKIQRTFENNINEIFLIKEEMKDFENVLHVLDLAVIYKNKEIHDLDLRDEIRKNDYKNSLDRLSKQLLANSNEMRVKLDERDNHSKEMSDTLKEIHGVMDGLLRETLKN